MVNEVIKKRKLITSQHNDVCFSQDCIRGTVPFILEFFLESELRKQSSSWQREEEKECQTLCARKNSTEKFTDK